MIRQTSECKYQKNLHKIRVLKISVLSNTPMELNFRFVKLSHRFFLSLHIKIMHMTKMFMNWSIISIRNVSIQVHKGNSKAFLLKLKPMKSIS